jgi:phosphate transport system permease protein
MPISYLLLTVLAIAGAAYYGGLLRSRALAEPLGGIRQLRSRPVYYALLATLWSLVPAAVLLGAWLLFDGPLMQQAVVSALPEASRPDDPGRLSLVMSRVENIASGALNPEYAPAELVEAAERLRVMRNHNDTAMTLAVMAVAVLGAGWGLWRVRPDFHARLRVEKTLRILLMLCASVAIVTTLGILLSVLFESIRFFDKVPFTEFLFGTHWSPQTALRADQVASEGGFGAVPLFAGTLLISAIALAVAVPVGLLSAIYLAEYAHSRFRAVAKPALEVLAGVPTVVYGFFAALTVAPFMRDLGESFGLDVAAESALAAGLVMGVMIIPFVSSLADDVITAVPRALREGSLGLGATKSETIKQVIIPAALPGIMGGILLAASRAIGETMIVVMAAGLAANLTANPLEAVTTVTVQIVTLLTGDQEFDSAKTLAAFALGLMLFLTTLVLNIIALHIVKKYREEYD